MIHPQQPLTQAIQDAPLQELTNAEAESCYRYYTATISSPPLPFHEWLTVNRIRIS
jgi:hypothetical protein